MSTAIDTRPIRPVITGTGWTYDFEFYGADISQPDNSISSMAWAIAFAPARIPMPQAGDVHQFLSTDASPKISFPAANTVRVTLLNADTDWKSANYLVELRQLGGASDDVVYRGTAEAARSVGQLASKGGGGSSPAASPSQGRAITRAADGVRIVRGEAAGSAAAAAASAAAALASQTAAAASAAAALASDLAAEAAAAAAAGSANAASISAAAALASQTAAAASAAAAVTSAAAALASQTASATSAGNASTSAAAALASQTAAATSAGAAATSAAAALASQTAAATSASNASTSASAASTSAAAALASQTAAAASAAAALASQTAAAGSATSASTSATTATTQAAAAAASAALALALVGWSAVAANHTVAPPENLLCNTSGGPFTLLLPASPAANAAFSFLDAANTFEANPLTIDPNGHTMSLAGVSDTTWRFNRNGLAFGAVWTGATWQLF